MEKITSYKNECEGKMICRYENCDTVEESCPYMNVDNCLCLQDILKELAEYKDLEKQGRLKRLPCLVGDTVWELCKCNDGKYRIFPMKVTKVVPYGSIIWIKGKIPIVWNIYATSNDTDMYKSFYDLGKTVFLSEVEAEAALANQNK